MNEDFGFSLQHRGAHRLAGCTVLQVVPALDGAPGLADAGLAAIAVAAALAEVGARPLVAAPAGRLVPELQAVGGVWLDFPSRNNNPLAMVLLSRRLGRLIAREGVDLVHARSRRAGWISHAAARRAGVPFATSLVQLSPGQGIIRQRYSSIMAKGDVVMAGSRFAAATVTTLYPAAAGRVALVRPGVDLRPFTPAAIAASRVLALRQAWGVAPDERILLLVARPSVWKGHKVLIEAVRLLREGGISDLKLVFVQATGQVTGQAAGQAAGQTTGKRGGKGAGSAFGREIELAVGAAGLAGRVVRVAGCTDMPAALLAAAAVVLPSIEPEAFGRVAVEAQGVGTPVVVSDGGALPETVLAPPDVEAGRRTGWRVSPGDPAALAGALGEALALGASGRDALGQRARRQAEERFSVERMARETLHCYAALLEREPAPS